MADSDTTLPPGLEGAYARLEQAIELFRTRWICDGWRSRFDEKAANRALTHMRVILNDKSGYMNELSYRAVFGFLASHEIDCNWVFLGNVDGMICKLAAQSTQALQRG